VTTLSTKPLRHALSFDIEDWFHMVEIDAVADPATWPGLPSIVVDRTKWIVDTLGEAGVRATFFVLGWVADRYPQVVQTIAAGGHEIGTHSFMHGRVDRMTPEAFREDLRRSIDVLEQHGGRKVNGFRAPSFSITPGTEWAFDVMHDVGLRYDASLFPARRGHGGYVCPQRAHAFTGAPSGRPMPELPMSVLKVGPVRLPFSGGGYLRLLPWRLIRHGFRAFERNGTPVVVYLHPRDFEADCPRVPMPPHRRFKSYVGLRSTERKLRLMLQTYQFGTCEALLGMGAA
jgi:polysaccharide deacetylase family protein (PEP-CTERM system associated)